jgi:hypothetical protein
VVGANEKSKTTQPKTEKPEPEPVGDDPLSQCLADNILDLCEEEFPNGEKIGRTWAIGDEKGAPGQSLRISLAREKAGLWTEFDGQREGHNFLELLARAKGISQEEAFTRIRERHPDYFERRAVIFHPARNKGLLNFCRALARAIEEVDAEIYNSCGMCVIPTTHRMIGEVEVARLSLKELSSHALKSEIQKYVPVYRHTSKDRTSRVLALEDARTILESPAFLDGLRPIRGICDVALPCGIADGELVAFREGYNPESGILVKTAGFEFAHDWSLERAVKYYRDLYSEFCFAPGDKRRSLAVAIAMNLTLFGYYLLSPNALRPVFLSDANQEGAGKTLLIKIALIGRYGNAVLSPMPANEDQCQKHIYSAARCRDGVVAWDNIKGEIQSAALEQAVTTVYLNARLLHTQTTQDVRHELIFLLSTNTGSITPDLRRRSLSMELHLANLKAEDRKIENWLDDDRLLKQRANLCAAAWAVLRNWVESGRPEPHKFLPGFENWSQVIAGAVQWAGFACPTSAPHAKGKGIAINPRTQAIEDLVVAVAAQKLDKMVHFNELWEFASRLPSVRDVLSLDKEDASEVEARQRLGVILAKHDGVIVKGVYRLTRYTFPHEGNAIKITKEEH